jgi:hypothetical protein
LTGKLIKYSENVLQAGQRMVLKQGHPPEYLSRGGNIVFSAIRNNSSFGFAHIVVSLQLLLTPVNPYLATR